MADILYTYKNGVYVNLTNRCSCNCTFCVRTRKEGVNGEGTMWHEKEPDFHEIKREIDAFDFTGYEELVYCGYGEPTCALETLLASARYFKQGHKQKIRVNTNGLGRLYHGWDILAPLNEVVDGYSISLNAPNVRRYEELVRPSFENAFPELLHFAKDCKEAGKDVQFSVVTVIAEEEIEECRKIADSMGIRLKVREFS